MPSAGLRFESVTKRFGEVHAVRSLDLVIDDGEFLVLVGPSGCGKTTALRMIAGLEEPSEGTIRIGDDDVTHLPPSARDIAMVFQSYALYPHMTVLDNLAFGLKQRRTPKAEIEARVASAAAMLDINHLLARKPRELSGGQRQRVALGRAIVRRPRVFLMDEPLSNLDAQLRVHTRGEIARMHRTLGTTFVYVTHDQVEAMTMGTRIAVMKDGVLQQVDTPRRLYDEPANTFVATFLGSPAMNVIEGESVAWGEGLAFAGAGTVMPLPPALAARVGGAAPLIVGLRPEHFERDPRPFRGQGLGGVVELVEPHGSDLFVTVSAAGLPITARLEPSAAVSLGDAIELIPNLASAHVFDANGVRLASA